MRVFQIFLRRELLLVSRIRGMWFEPLAFFTLILLLFPLAVTVEHHLLERFAPGILWLAALLANSLSVERLLSFDRDDGSLDQLLLAPQSLTLAMLAKTFAHWLTVGVPIAILAPLYGYLWFLPGADTWVVSAALLPGTWLIAMLGLFGASLTVRFNGSNLLLALLVMPLYIPVMVFGAIAINAATLGLTATGQLAILFAMALMASVLLPLFTAVTLRMMSN